MNKKGDSRTTLWIFYIVLVIIITVFLVNVIDNAVSGKGFTKQKFINDLGLTLDTIQSSNYDLEVRYKVPFETNLAFSKNSIKIVGENSYYNFAQDTNFNIFSGGINVKENSILIITKKDNTISINIKENG